MSIKNRIEKIEAHTESKHGEQILLILKLCCGANPTDEEIEAAKNRYLEEHPDHDGSPILLKLTHDGPHFHHGKEIIYKNGEEVT